jgi:hypothetical protein
MSFQAFSDWIPHAMQKYKMSREARAALVCHQFKELAPSLLGEGAADKVHAKFFKHNTLYVRVPSSVWAQRVFIHRHELLVKLNLHMDGDVHEIRTQVETG